MSEKCTRPVSGQPLLLAAVVAWRAKVAPQALRRSSVDSSIAQFSMGDRLPDKDGLTPRSLDKPPRRLYGIKENRQLVFTDRHVAAGGARIPKPAGYIDTRPARRPAAGHHRHHLSH